MTIRNFLAFAFIAILTIVSVGCSGQKPEKDAGSTEAVSEVQGDPIAEFDGGVITVEEIQALLDKMRPQERAQYEAPGGTERLVDTLAQHAIMAQAARDEGIDKDADVLVMMRIFNNLRLSQEYFDKKFKPILDNPVVTEEDIRAYYDENRGKFDNSQVKASHILVKDEAEAREIYEKVKAAPETFAEVAKEKSIDSGSGKNGGDLGWFKRGQMVPAFEEKAFSLEKGEIGEPVKSMFGWHVIYLEDKTETGIQTFEEAKPGIEMTLKQTIGKTKIDTMINELKESKNLKIHSEKFSKITSGAPAAPPTALTPPPPPDVKEIQPAEAKSGEAKTE